MGWSPKDLTIQTQAPLATFRPWGYVYAGSQHVVYEGFTASAGSDGRVHELYWDGSWHHHDLTDAAGAPPIGAGSSPTGYSFAEPDTIYGTQHVVYVGSDSHVHELWFDQDTSDGWQHHDLTQAANAPPAVGVAVGYGYNNVQRVFYEGTDQDIHVLTWNENGGWNDYDLSQATGAPPAAGPPSAYVFDAQGSEHAIYLGLDGHIHELWKLEAGWHHGDLTVGAGAPLASDQPSGCALRGDLRQHIGYRGFDGHIYELLWFNGGWQARDVSAMVSAPPATPGAVAAYAFSWDQSVHFIYTGADGHVRELWFIDDWNLNDLSIDTNAAPAISEPAGYTFDIEHTQHVVYVDDNHHVIELMWQPGSSLLF